MGTMVVVHRGQFRVVYVNEEVSSSDFYWENDFICKNINAHLTYSYLLCGVGGLLRDHISDKEL